MSRRRTPTLPIAARALDFCLSQMLTFSAVIVILFALAGVALTLLTLPGTWLALLAAIACKFWQPELMSWWVIGAAGALAVLAEILEFAVSAAGATRAGGTKRGGIGALMGGLVGAIVGAPFLLIIGAIIGGVLGAGLGALLAERLWAKRSWEDSAKSGQGAAVGRLLATILKTAVSGAQSLLLCIAAVLALF